MASPPGTARRDRTHLFLFAILLVVFLIISAAVWYVLNGSEPAGPAPFVEFTSPTLGGPGDASVSVESVSRDVGLGSFRVSLVDLGTSATIFDAQLRAGTLYSGGGAIVSFEDNATTGRLSPGDLFRLVNMPTGVTYSLVLVYIPESRTVASVTIPL